MTTYQPQLIWQEQPVGLFDNPIPDMWYLTGKWLSNHSEAAAAFETLAKRLDLRATHRNWDAEIDIIMLDLGGPTRAIVIGLSPDNLLFVRRIYS